MKKLLFFFAFSLLFYSNFAVTHPAKLDTEELRVVKEIWGKLGLITGRKKWDFDNDLCSDKGEWTTYISCNCDFESNTTCRVNGIYLSMQNISGALLLEFTKLRHLEYVDLTRNYISGTVPSEWATMRLDTIMLTGNRLSGPFPTVLTRITTLKDLSIEANCFSGPIPEDIANLKTLDRLALSSNHFTGELPIALAKLTVLTHLRISDNNFTGKIPNFISQMTLIRKLHIQGCSFEGPFPSSISNLTELVDLRISDLKGGAISTFPPLKEMTLLTKLVLRNCFIHGTIPVYVGRLMNLQTLNNINPCLRKDFPCTKPYTQQIHSLHINCGGEEANINNTEYVDDTWKKVAYNSGGTWAFSSTGNFKDGDNENEVYILSNTSNLNNISKSDTELYTKARTASISLTYYGLCLMNGKYTVRLHFAEIVFTQDNSYYSLGKRMFDVYVQGELKLKDFDVVKEAGGTGIAVIKSYTVDVKNNTLKIQLYWAGKGTTAIPVRGSYGPIISAISVDP